MKLNTVAGRLMLKHNERSGFYGKVISFITWLLNQLKDGLSIAIFIIVLIIMYSPCWLCMLLYSIFGNSAFLAVSTTYMAFWAGPFTPFFPLCIAITFAIRKLIKKIFKR